VCLNTEEIQGKGNFDVLEKLFADDFIDHTPQPDMTPDKAGISFAVSTESTVNTLEVNLAMSWRNAKEWIGERSADQKERRKYSGCSSRSTARRA